MTTSSTTTSASPATRSPRVAVIGSGLAGLTTAYLLRLRGVTVYLIEKSENLGFHSSSVDIPFPLGHKHDGDWTSKSDGRDGTHPPTSWTVDVPMRSFQGGYYPHLIALYRHLGIPLRATQFTFSFARYPSRTDTHSPGDATSTAHPSTARPASPHFIHSGASGLSLPSLPSRSFSSALSLLLALITWIAYAGAYLLLLALSFMSYHHLLPCVFGGTFASAIDHIALVLYRPIPIPYIPLYTPFGRIWRSFVHTVVVPLFSAVGTMPEADVYGMPAACVLDYVHKTVGTDHYTLGQGYSARTVAERLARSVQEQGQGFLRLGTTITSLHYKQSQSQSVGGELDRGWGRGKISISSIGREDLEVDRVVLATPASVASTFLAMLDDSLDPSAGSGMAGAEDEAERLARMMKALSQVRYKETIVVTHCDSTVLPTSQADIRDINLIQPIISSPSSSSHPGSSSSPSSKSAQSRTASDRRSPKADSIDANADADGGRVVPHFDPLDGYTMATHVIRLPPASSASPSHAFGPGLEQTVYQTTNPLVPIRPDAILGLAQLERALPLQHPSRTLAALHPGPGLVNLVGSYAWPGIPLLEGCVGSAKRVVDSLAADLHLDQDDQEGHQSSGVKVDWEKGRGGWNGRLWRWRRSVDNVDM